MIGWIILGIVILILMIISLCGWKYDYETKTWQVILFYSFPNYISISPRMKIKRKEGG